MNGNIVVDVEGIKSFAKSINQKRQEIMEIYNYTLKSIINNSHDCLAKSNVSFDEMQNKFIILFKQFDNNVNDLVKVLNEKIVPNYENLMEDLNILFSNRMNELQQLLMEEKK